MLTSLPLLTSYRSDRNDLLRDFYIPCMSQSVQYSRAAGYFTSDALSAASRGLTRLIASGGHMRMVASPVLDPDDVEALENGYRTREEVVERALLRSLASDAPDPVRQRLQFLAWLVSENLLDLKVAVTNRRAGYGIYHEKIGVFEDELGQRVVFTGSANESIGGYVTNFESVDLYRSWVGADEERVRSKVADFEALWNDCTPSLDVYALPEAVRRALLQLRPAKRPEQEPEEFAIPLKDTTKDWPIIPSGLQIRDYQKDAVQAWFANNGLGLWRMATGTGKTIAALALVAQLARALQDRERPLLAIVICPFQHLVSQWAEQARDFGIDPTMCFQSRDLWFDRALSRVRGCNAGRRPFAMLIATNDTFQGTYFQELVSQIGSEFILIADEVHNVGSTRLRQMLPSSAQYRLGLSATPERWYDDVGTRAIQDYFGAIIYELALEDAIRLGALTPYLYYPQVVELQGEELETYLELSEQIGRVMGVVDSEPDSNDDRLKLLLIKRARLVGSASGKLPALRRVVEPLLRATTHNLFYCGDGRMPDGEPDGGLRQLDAVVQLLGRDLGMRVNSYTAETFLDSRAELRQEFARGELQGLVAIKCLDEGVDIPETRRAFILASSTNPRQFVQRRGRILRRAPHKERAEIYDFIVVPPDSAINDARFNVERRLARRELERVALFARLAENGPQALADLLPLRRRYNLLDVS